MGMDRVIRFGGEAPDWGRIALALQERAAAVEMRMIDGQPAFPDEAPEGAWRELRVAAPSGMMTVRAGPGSLTCVVWGNATPALQRDWLMLCWACAEAGGGEVDGPDGPLAAEAFARAHGLL